MRLPGLLFVSALVGLAWGTAVAQQPPAPAPNPAMTKAEAAVNAAFAQFTASLKAYEDEHRAELVAAERDRLAAEKALADERGAGGHAHTFTVAPAGQKR
jgi:hypothetical protein